MIFMFHENAGSTHLHVKGAAFKYLIKVRRHQEGDAIDIRAEANPRMLHHYQIERIENRSVLLRLMQSEDLVIRANKTLHIIWCMIDTKSIEKVLPMLTELGVAKLSFVSCARSQGNVRLDFQRFGRIVMAAMQQCGRSEFMEFEQLQSLEEAVQRYDNLVYLDFGDTMFKGTEAIERVLVGCEGGFTDAERLLLASQQKCCFNTPMVLRSESAVCTIATQILL